jgi:hypothetical protein
MEIDDAQTILNAITVGAGILWIAGTWYVAKAGRVGKAPGPPAPQPMLVHDATVARAVVGDEDIEGIPRENQAAAVRSLATGIGHQLGSVRIAEETPGYIRFESPRAARRSLRLGAGEIWFSMQTDQSTHVDYAVEVAAGGVLLSLARLMNVLGLAAIAVGYFAISAWVIPDVGNRPQVFQMLQTIHFLWPPFLFAGLYRYQYSAVAGEFEAFIHNIPYLREKGDGGS